MPQTGSRPKPGCGHCFLCMKPLKYAELLQAMEAGETQSWNEFSSARAPRSWTYRFSAGPAEASLRATLWTRRMGWTGAGDHLTVRIPEDCTGVSPRDNKAMQQRAPEEELRVSVLPEAPTLHSGERSSSLLEQTVPEKPDAARAAVLAAEPSAAKWASSRDRKAVVQRLLAAGASVESAKSTVRDYVGTLSAYTGSLSPTAFGSMLRRPIVTACAVLKPTAASSPCTPMSSSSGVHLLQSADTPAELALAHQVEAGAASGVGRGPLLLAAAADAAARGSCARSSAISSPRVRRRSGTRTVAAYQEELSPDGSIVAAAGWRLRRAPRLLACCFPDLVIGSTRGRHSVAPARQMVCA